MGDLINKGNVPKLHAVHVRFVKLSTTLVC